MKTLRVLSISILASMVLTGCTTFNSESTSSSASSSSQPSSSSVPEPKQDEIDDFTETKAFTYITSSYSKKNITYYHSVNTYDVPYVLFDDFYNEEYCWLYYEPTVTKEFVSRGVYRYSSENGYFEIDCGNETIFVHNPSHMTCALDRYNDVPYIGDGIETQYVSLNDKTSLIEEQQDITFNLKDYHIDIIEFDQNACIPLMTLVDMLISPNGYSMAFNGKNLYCSAYFDSDSTLKQNYINQSPWKNSSYRTDTTADYTYNELCFNIDHFYGLKEDRGIDKIDTVIERMGLKDDLLSLNSRTYETAMQQFVGRYYADGHSGYTLNSPFQSNFGYNEYYSALSENQREIRLNEAIYENYSRRWPSGKGAGITFYGNTAIVIFDTFVKGSNTKGVDVSSQSYNSLHNSCSSLFFKKAFLDIKNHGGITKVVFDITCNGGGMVDALPWLEAYMTDDPFITFKNTVTGEVADNHYTVDLNQDGVINENDTYKGQYDFYILTSNYSFSCANAFATVAKAGGFAKIIGQRSGGGACVVAGFATASGTIIRNSGVWQLGMYGNSRSSNDAGIPVDYELSPEDFYNDEVIYNLVNAH